MTKYYKCIFSVMLEPKIIYFGETNIVKNYYKNERYSYILKKEHNESLWYFYDKNEWRPAGGPNIKELEKIYQTYIREEKLKRILK